MPSPYCNLASSQVLCGVLGSMAKDKVMRRVSYCVPTDGFDSVGFVLLLRKGPRMVTILRKTAAPWLAEPAYPALPEKSAKKWTTDYVV